MNLAALDKKLTHKRRIAMRQLMDPYRFNPELKRRFDEVMNDRRGLFLLLQFLECTESTFKDYERFHRMLTTAP